MNFFYHFSTLYGIGVVNRTISSFFGINDSDDVGGLQNKKKHWEQYLGCQPCLDRRRGQSWVWLAPPWEGAACYEKTRRRRRKKDQKRRHLSAETSRPSFSSRESSLDSSASLSPMSLTWVCSLGLVSLVLLGLKTGNGNPIYVNVSSTLTMNPATSLTIAVKFLTSLSRRRLSRSKASAFSVLAWTEIIRNVNSHLGELVQSWLKIPGIC